MKKAQGDIKIRYLPVLFQVKMDKLGKNEYTEKNTLEGESKG